jgi:putative transposon-encoded protein
MQVYVEKDVKIMKGRLSLGKDVERFDEKAIVKSKDSAKVGPPRLYTGCHACAAVLEG